ncbi:MAG: sigma-70 family RNA polymerase sigma factor [Planctomycetota bacterium]|nr:sigma-70 family RNA polymerase sigma factor [Planctomycetota bacterium]
MTEHPDYITQLQAMQEEAWSRLQDDYFRRIFFYVKRYVPNHQTAEDLTQEVFLGAVRGMPTFDSTFTLEQFLFGIARNRVIDHFRKHRIAFIPGKGDDGDASNLWLENMPNPAAKAAKDQVVNGEDLGRRQQVMAKILRELVGELWQQGEFQKLMVLEYLFVLGGRNKAAAERFSLADEKIVAGIKFRAIDKLRSLARLHDPNHSLFLGLWEPGAR